MSQTILRALLRLSAFAACLCLTAQAQMFAPVPPSGEAPAARAPGDRATGAAAELEEIRQQLREQREELERLRAALTEQTRLVIQLRARVGLSEGPVAASASAPHAVTEAAYRAADAAGVEMKTGTASGESKGVTSGPQDARLEERVARAEEQLKKTGETLARQLGSITFSGDLRLRYESIYGQLNASPSADDPSILGNPLSSRQRFRLRARLAARGQIGKEFDWGLRIATGTFPDVTSTNQTLTDFFSHKNFALNQAYLAYRPARVPGLQVQAGKFEVPWLRTEMTIDTDLQPEGFNESYTRTFKDSKLRQLSFVAWQLPFLERSSAFVVGADGQVDLSASRRAGRDLALYGGQLRARIELSKQMALTLSAADLYFSGTQFITPAQFFGGQIQVPVTVTIPATATTPARTVSGFAAIPRDMLISGGATPLGISRATNNAVNRDGRLSSGFNLLDLIARLDLTHSKRFPVMLLLNVVTNTQTRDVVTAGPDGADFVLPNDEKNGYWAEIQVGKTQERGDWLFSYTFIRIEKDAVLTPFNYSDLAQLSDVRVQRFIVGYAVDPRVTLSLTGLFTKRPNGLLGVFGTTPPGSLNRPTTRIQFDTLFRF
jgi:hypothetical protein